MRVERNPSLKQTGMDDDDSAVATCKHLSSENRDCAEDAGLKLTVCIPNIHHAKYPTLSTEK